MKLVWVVVGFFLLSLNGALSQAETGEAAEDVAVQFGFADEIVADAWNPLRVTLRDLESAELVLELDVGTLRGGLRVLRYTAPLAGGQGLYTFEDDIYLPTWRTFSWLVRTPERVLASGTVERRRVDNAPLHLVLAPEIGAGGRFFGEAARVVEVAAADLPERAAAYSGVRSVLALPGAAPPTTGALVSAATAGSTVLLVGALGGAYNEISALVPPPGGRLGAGWLGRTNSTRRAVQRALSAHPKPVPDTLLATLVSEDLTRTPEHLAVSWLLMGLGGYTLVTLALLRFGGAPGLLAALLLAAILGTSAARLRPAEPLLTRSRSLSLGAGGLALETELEAIFSFPAERAKVAHAAHPLPVTAARAWTTGPERFSTELDAYESIVLAGRPRLAPAVFGWQGNALLNETETALGDVFVVGDGRQAPIPVGETVTPESGNLLPQALYAGLAPLLPDGSALARSGGRIYVALPELPAEAEP